MELSVHVQVRAFAGMVCHFHTDFPHRPKGKTCQRFATAAKKNTTATSKRFFLKKTTTNNVYKFPPLTPVDFYNYLYKLQIVMLL